MSPRVVIVGPPGAGKSTVAAILAERMGLTVRDTDSDVEAATDATIVELFVDRGEEYFRDREREAVVTALAEHDGVLALGGGAVMDPRTEADLAGHAVVFLDVGLPEAAKRVGFNASRPLLIGNPRAQWLRLMEVRRPVYERVSTIVVPTDDLDPAAVADRVEELLGPTDR
ncbi:MAG TPA: shikimate kinase [Actinomycetales bacterium]|nr:shikimate kinase [Actinomycetales bacterium]